MMRLRGMIWTAGIVVLVGAAANAAVTTDSLLDDLTNLERLSVLASPAYTTTQASSYDRLSKAPDDAAAWFANRDRGQHIRTEKVAARTECVMMDAQGPGAIVRIWSANPAGTLRVYLDGQGEPVIEAAMDELLGGKFEGLPEPLAGVRSRGWNLYFPVPYAQHCKVTVTDKSLYYHVNYRTYAADTKVESFVRQDLARLAGKIDRIAAALRAPSHAVERPADGESTPLKAVLKAGEAATLAELTGPKAIHEFRVALSAEVMPAAARGVVLSMTFDGETTVECPLGDFFGTAPGLTPFEALPVGVTSGEPAEMWCHWVMPFQRTAKIEVKNLGQAPAELKGTILAAPQPWTERSLHFRAKWRLGRDLPTRPFTDWAHLRCQGQGRFVGGSLSVINPVRGWWGEGDEKIYVDGEAFPSHFGTGSEDYYGYAWCNNERFVHAYHNQPRADGPGNFGHTTNNRFHIIDDIPFSKAFRFDMENWHSKENVKTTRAAVSYWYARPGGSDFFKPLTAEDVSPPAAMAYKIAHVPGAIEGEGLAEITVPGNCRVIDIDDRCSGEKYLWWERGKPGDKLALGFEVASPSKKEVLACLVRGRTHGRVQLYVNGLKAGEPVDLYHDRIWPTAEISLGTHDLAQGSNQLTVEMLGANEKAGPKHEFGIDYLRLK